MSLYDPYGSSEDGVIVLKPEHYIADNDSLDVEVDEWKTVPGGIIMHQGEDTIALDPEQVEALYEILKHNR